MKYLQDLVPGCNKITGKAGMLDEIINYVQSLQRQVEVFLINIIVFPSYNLCYIVIILFITRSFFFFFFTIFKTVLVNEISCCES